MCFLVNSVEKWTPNKRLKKTMAKRKDGVDEIYRDTYMKWAGRTHKASTQVIWCKVQQMYFPQTN